MNLVLDVMEVCEHDGHLKIWINLRIYHRINETFFVINSLIWRLKLPSGTILFSFEIEQWTAVSPVFCFFGPVWSSKSQIHKSQKRFSLFVCLRSVIAGSNCVNTIFKILVRGHKKIACLKKLNYLLWNANQNWN